MFDHRKASFRVLTLVLLMASGFGAAALAQSPEGGGPSGPDVQLRPSAPDAAPIDSWVRLYRGPLNAWYQGAPANDIVETGDGGYVTAGNVNTCENAPYCTWGAVVRYGADGAVAWTRIFGQSGVPSTYLNGIVKTDDGGYAATGYTAAGGIGRVDLLVVKLDAFGTVMWQNTYGVGRLGRVRAEDLPERQRHADRRRIGVPTPASGGATTAATGGPTPRGPSTSARAAPCSRRRSWGRTWAPPWARPPMAGPSPSPRGPHPGSGGRPPCRSSTPPGPWAGPRATTAPSRRGTGNWPTDPWLRFPAASWSGPTPIRAPPDTTSASSRWTAPATCSGRP